jgi:transposase
MTSRAKKEERMRGDAIDPDAVFSYVSAAKRVPPDHPLRAVRTLVDAVLRELSPQFQKLYSHTGRPSIPPERLLRALLLQVLYSIRSERMLMEQLDYNLTSTAKSGGTRRTSPPRTRMRGCTPRGAGRKRSSTSWVTW